MVRRPVVVVVVEGAYVSLLAHRFKLAHIQTAMHVHKPHTHTHKPSAPLLIKTWRSSSAYQNLERESQSARVRVKSPTPTGYMFLFFVFFPVKEGLKSKMIKLAAKSTRLNLIREAAKWC